MRIELPFIIHTLHKQAEIKKITDYIHSLVPIREDVELSVKFYYPSGANVGDIDNLLKILFDGLQRANVLINDRQIKVLHAAIIEDDEMIEIVIKKL